MTHLADMQQPGSRSLPFVMHANLMQGIMGRQAPDLPKAVLELVMNSIDAGASKVDILLDQERLVVEDDGGGLGSDLAHIEATFGTLGFPHDAEERVYGEFGLGRGQALCLGSVTYRSGPFVISVDIPRTPGTWQVENADGFHAGCRVEIVLDHPPASADAEVEALGKLVRFVPGTVTINGRQVNTPAAEVAWDHETPTAWFRFASGPLQIFNRGAFVRDYDAREWGLGGIVVTKERLRLTLGRNEVMRDCPVFRDVVSEMDDAFCGMLAKRHDSYLPAAMRRRALRQLVQGTLAADHLMRFALLRDARGRWMTLHALSRVPTATVAPTGHPVAWRAAEHMNIMPLCSTTLADDEVSLHSVVKAMRRDGLRVPALVTWESVLAEVVMGREVADPDQLTTHAKAALFGAQAVSRAVAALLNASATVDDVFVHPRRIIPATRSSEETFGDGETFIAVSEDLLDRIGRAATSTALGAAVVARAYLAEPRPTDGSPRSPEHQRAMDGRTAQGLAALATRSSPERANVQYSPLDGDPFDLPRNWQRFTSVGDLGDVAKLWETEIGRRCAGLGIKPPMRHQEAASTTRTRDRMNAAVPAALTDNAWAEEIEQSLQQLLKRMGLTHWTFEAKPGRVVLTRARDPRLMPENYRNRRDVGSYVSGIMSECAGYWQSRGDGRGHWKKRWLRERLPKQPDNITFDVRTRGGSGRRPGKAVSEEAARITIMAELALAGIHVPSHELTKRQAAALRSAARVRLSATRWRGAKPNQYCNKGHLRAEVSIDNGEVDIALHYYGSRISSSGGVIGGSRKITVHPYYARGIGWPGLAQAIRRTTLVLIGLSYLAQRARSERGKDIPRAKSDQDDDEI